METPRWRSSSAERDGEKRPTADTDDLAAIVQASLAAMPAWIRADLTAREPTARGRAEEVLAAIIAEALGRRSRA